MKAARSGGWIDSDSGSELEIALEHSPRDAQSQGHTSRINGGTPRSINNHQHSLYIKDGIPDTRGDAEIDPTYANLNLAPPPFPSNQKSLTNPRIGEVPNLKTRPLTLASLNHHLVDHPASSNTHVEPRHSPLFDTPNSPYDPRTPSTPASTGTSSGSPYVRHHFKWEYLPPSTKAEGAHQPGLQPRFVESSSPPHNINFDETFWRKGIQQKELILPNNNNHTNHNNNDIEVSLFHGQVRHAHEAQRPPHLAGTKPGFVGNNGNRSVSYSSVHPKSRSPSQQGFGSGYNSRISIMELPSTHMESLNQPTFDPSHKPWAMAARPQEVKAFSRNGLNPASVSSVPFSLAPAAPIRFSAPEIDGQSKGSSLGRQASPGSPIRESDASVSSRDTPSAKATSVISASASSAASLKDSTAEREKQAIRARLMGSTSIDNFQTRLQTFNKPLGVASPPADGGHPGHVGNLPSLFHQLRVSHSSQPISAAQSRVHSSNDSSPLRSVSANYPTNQNYGSPIFYSSHPHASVNRHGPFAASMTPSSNNSSQLNQLTPTTPITPMSFGVNGQLQTHNSGVLYSPNSSTSKSSFLPVIVPTVPGLGGPVSTPLPGQVQPEEVRKSVKTQPPVVNTGNSGAMIPQPGDWMCICGFVNWRRRKVCMRCFPFADGNDSVGAMMALNAQRAALLAAGVQLPKDQPNGSLAVSNSLPAIFGRPPLSTFQESAQQLSDKQPSFGQPPSSSAEFALSNYGRPLESGGMFNSHPQRLGLNPFDKSSPLPPISPTTGAGLNRSPDGAQQRYLEVNQQNTINREPEINSAISRPEKNSKSLRARLVAPGEEKHQERNSWEDVLSKSPRPRSFSMGAKSVWEPDEEIGPVGGPHAADMIGSKKLENNPIGKQTNGNSGSKDALAGSQAVSGRLAPDNMHQELNTINDNRSAVNRQRTTTSPTSSWQAIKALWQ